MKYSAAQQRRFFGIAFWGSLIVYLACVVLFIVNPSVISFPIAVILFAPTIMLMLRYVISDRASDFKSHKWNTSSLIPLISTLAMICFLYFSHTSLSSDRYAYFILSEIPASAMSDALEALSVLKGQQSEA